MHARRAGCDEISWSESKKYHGLAYDRASSKWTDKGAARCESLVTWQGLSIGLAECQRICEGDETCNGISSDLNDTSDGACWICGPYPEDCGNVWCKLVRIVSLLVVQLVYLLFISLLRLIRLLIHKSPTRLVCQSYVSVLSYHTRSRGEHVRHLDRGDTNPVTKLCPL